MENAIAAKMQLVPAILTVVPAEKKTEVKREDERQPGGPDIFKYPPVLMPPSQSQYIKAKKYDFF